MGTVYVKDNESKNIWLKKIGIKKTHLLEKGIIDNFWSMDATGPCGPCSEIFYDRGNHINDLNERFIEIWNLVFMQFNRNTDGSLIKLDFPSVDTGMGVERITSVLENKEKNFHTSIFRNLFLNVKNKLIKNKKYDEKSIHVIIDHIRSSVFLISEGIVPNNEGKGYVLRRIIRRAMLHGSKIGLNRIFFNELVIILAKEMQEVYPDLMDKILVIENIIKREEEKFFFNLSRGLKLVDNALKISENKILTGKQIFDL